MPAPRSRRARGPLVMISKQDRRQRVAHVVLDIVGKHTQEDVRFHAMLEPMVHGPHLQIDTFQQRKARSTSARFLYAATAAWEPILSAGRLCVSHRCRRAAPRLRSPPACGGTLSGHL